MSATPAANADCGSSLRLFVACALPRVWLAALEAGQVELRGRLGSDAGALRWARPNGFHLTLHFLGATSATQENAVRQAMTRAAAAVGSFVLELGALGTFGGRRPRVVWVGLRGDLEAVAALQRLVTRELGAAENGERFSPHVTLARIPPPERGRPPSRPHVQPSVLEAALAATRLAAVPPHRVTAISLIQSELLPGGARYTERFSASLRGASVLHPENVPPTWPEPQ